MDSANHKFYAGVRCATNDKVYISSVWLLSSFNLTTVPLNEWRTAVLFFKGHGTGGTATATNPMKLPANTTYVSFSFVANYNDTANVNEMEIDCFTVQAFDEDGTNRLYLGIASNGEINPDMVITTSITDDAITTPKLYAMNVTSGELTTAYLAALSTDLGDVYAGSLTITNTSGIYFHVDENEVAIRDASDNIIFQIPMTTYSYMNLRYGIKLASGSQFNLVPASSGGVELRLQATSGQEALISTLGSPFQASDIHLQPYQGHVKLGGLSGSYSSVSDQAIVGYLPVRDGAGNIRKLAVIS